MRLLDILSDARARHDRIRRAARTRAVARFEALEGRQLMAASVTHDAAAKSLAILGTDSKDSILLTESGGVVGVEVYTDGIRVINTAFPRSVVSKVSVDAKGGDDKIAMPTLTVPGVLSGGAGNDDIYGGTAGDTLEGGADNDRLDGGNGADLYKFSGSANLGSDRIVERFAQGSDTLDFSAFGRGINLDLTTQSTAQTVSSGFLSLTIDIAGDSKNSESLENVYGSPYNDTIRGSARFSTLKGNGGNDILEGRGGDDALDGGAGDDTYVFGAVGYLGADTITDASGTDTLDFSSYGQTVVLDLANTSRQDVLSYFPDDDINSGSTRLTLTLPAGFENVKGSDSKDWIKGNSVANALYGNGGNDILEGQGGNDTLDGGTGDDTYRFELAKSSTASLGTDTIVQRNGQGNDTLDFTSFGHGVNVDLAATNAAQTVTFGKLSLNISVPSGQLGGLVNVNGSAYSDAIRGNSSANILRGGVGNDTIEGRGGNDRLEGGQGDDTYVFSGSTSLGTDTLVEDDDSHGGGMDAHDKLDFSSFGFAANVNLDTNSNQTIRTGILSLVLSSNSGVEDVTGTAYADTIRGNGRANKILGQAGNDTVYGGTGNDTLYGGNDDDALYGDEGSDTLYGEAGKDRLSGGIDAAIDYLYGGAGADIFAAEWYTESGTRKNRDKNQDYSAASGDTVI